MKARAKPIEKPIYEERHSRSGVLPIALLALMICATAAVARARGTPWWPPVRAGASAQDEQPRTLRDALALISSLRAELADAQARLETLADELDQAQALIRRYEAALVDQPDDEPPPPDREPPPDRGDPPPPTSRWQSPVQRIDPVRPTVVHAHLYPGRYELASGVVVATPFPAADAYEAVEPGIDGLVVLGVHGAVGRAGIGTAWSQWDRALLDDDEPIEVAFVGLDDKAEIGPLHLGSNYDQVARAEFYGLGIRGALDSFALRQEGKVDVLVFDGFWILPADGIDQYASGFHLHRDWESLTIKGYEARNLLVREHPFYFKPGGRLQVLDCELDGGNRTGLHIRSHGDPFASPRPHGEILIEGNWAKGFGWDHANPDGGQWLTVWCSLEYRVAIRGNRLEDGRYGGLGILQGVASTSPYLTPDGWSHTEVWLEGNTFACPRGNRSAGMLTAAREVHLAGANAFEGPQDLVVDDWWSQMYTAAKSTGKVVLHAGATIDGDVVRWDAATKGYLPVGLE